MLAQNDNRINRKKRYIDWKIRVLDAVIRETIFLNLILQDLYFI